MLFWHIFCLFWCPVVSMVTFSSNLGNFERNKKKYEKLKKKYFNLKKNKKNLKIKKTPKKSVFFILKFFKKKIQKKIPNNPTF